MSQNLTVEKTGLFVQDGVVVDVTCVVNPTGCCVPGTSDQVVVVEYTTMWVPTAPVQSTACEVNSQECCIGTASVACCANPLPLVMYALVVGTGTFAAANGVWALNYGPIPSFITGGFFSGNGWGAYQFTGTDGQLWNVVVAPCDGPFLNQFRVGLASYHYNISGTPNTLGDPTCSPFLTSVTILPILGYTGSAVVSVSATPLPNSDGVIVYPANPGQTMSTVVSKVTAWLPGNSQTTSTFCVVNPQDCCAPPVSPILVPCCPVPIPATITIALSSKTGTCGCLPDSVTLTWDESVQNWSTTLATPSCTQLSGKIILACTDVISPVWTISFFGSPGVGGSIVSCNPLVVTFSLSLAGTPCFGTAVATFAPGTNCCSTITINCCAGTISYPTILHLTLGGGGVSGTVPVYLADWTATSLTYTTFGNDFVAVTGVCASAVKATVVVSCSGMLPPDWQCTIQYKTATSLGPPKTSSLIAGSCTDPVDIVFPNMRPTVGPCSDFPDSAHLTE